jgi:hypothetical protein
MPRRRPVDKGSFGGHFDELVKFFPTGRTSTRKVKASKPKRKAKSAAAINQFLFDHAAH